MGKSHSNIVSTLFFILVVVGGLLSPLWALSEEPTHFTWSERQTSEVSNNVLYFNLRLDNYPILYTRAQASSLHSICVYLGHARAANYTLSDKVNVTVARDLSFQNGELSYNIDYRENDFVQILQTLSCLKK